MGQSVGNLAVVISGNAAPLSGVMNQVVRDVGSFQQQINKITINPGKAAAGAAGGGLLGSILGGAVGGLAAGGAMAAFGLVKDGLSGIGEAAMWAGKTAITAAVDYERLSAAFEVMAGSATVGKKLLDDIQKMAIATPFASADLASSAQLLLGMGVKVEAVLPSLKALGEIAGGDAVKLGRLADAFGKVMSQGRMQGDELNRFLEMGVDMESFAKASGKSVLEFRSALEQGAIGSDVMVKAINSLTGQGGRFAGMMAKASQTVGGQWNALTESLTVSLQKIGLTLFQKFNVAESIGNIADTITDALGGAGEALGPFLDKAKILGGDVLNALRAGWEAFVGTFDRNKSALRSLLPAFDDVRDGLKFLIDSLGWFVETAGFALAPFAKYWSDYFIRPFARMSIALTQGLRDMLGDWAIIADSFGKRDTAAMLNRLANGLNPLGIGNRLLTVADMVETAGEGAAAWAADFRFNLARAVAPARQVADVLSQIGQIPIQAVASAEAQQLATSLKQSMLGGVTPLEQFKRQFGLLNEANKFGLLKPGEFNEGAANVAGILEKAFAKGAEMLPKAMARGTQAAESAISRAMRSNSRDPQKRLEELLKRAGEDQRRHIAETKAVGDAVRNLNIKGVGI